MAAGILATPGTDAGPCKDPCRHVDCAVIRNIAAAKCIHCDEPIGYATRYYRVDTLGPGWHVYTHALCEEKQWDEINAQRLTAGRRALTDEEMLG